MIKCSACILTYNSAKTLEKSLESLRDFSDIVILDGGSTDNTLEIAKRYNARVFPQQEDGGKIEDFTKVRERMFSLAKEDWRLWLDSDEWLSEEAQKEIKKITEEGDKNKLYSFTRKAVIKNKVIEHAYFYPEYCKRLFHKDSGVHLKHGKKVHEDLIAGEGTKVEKNDAVIFHKWLETYRELIKKDEHYLSLTILGKEKFSFFKKIRLAFVNCLKGFKVCISSFFIYIRHGFKKTLPVKYSWRFARYHFLYALKTLFLKK